MPFPPARSTTYNQGRQLIDGADMQALFDALGSFQSLTPAGAVSQAAATALNAANVEILAGSGASSVLLPPSYAGAEVTIVNNSSNGQQVYGTGADVVQSGSNSYAAAATGVALATLTSAIYRCVKKGFWQRFAAA